MSAVTQHTAPMSAFRHLLRGVAAALIVTALAAPTAGARPIYDSPGRPTHSSLIPTRIDDEGFDLGSAAVGAVSASAFLLLTGAGIAFVGQRRHRVGVVG
jgi:hypothetical protein